MNKPVPPQSFGTIAKLFHWGILGLFLFQYGIALVMYGIATPEYYPKTLFMLHKSVGILLLFLAIFRLLWRKMMPLPAWPESVTNFEKKAFHILENGLYILMILMPVSGYLFSLAGGHGFQFFGLFQFPDLIGKQAVISEIGKFLHRIFAFLILGFVASHVMLILRHHYDTKDRFLERMSPMRCDK